MNKLPKCVFLYMTQYLNLQDKCYLKQTNSKYNMWMQFTPNEYSNKYWKDINEYKIKIKKCVCTDCPNCNERVYAPYRTYWNNCVKCDKKICNECIYDNTCGNNYCKKNICNECNMMCRYCNKKNCGCMEIIKCDNCDDSICENCINYNYYCEQNYVDCTECNKKYCIKCCLVCKNCERNECPKCNNCNQCCNKCGWNRCDMCNTVCCNKCGSNRCNMCNTVCCNECKIKCELCERKRICMCQDFSHCKSCNKLVCDDCSNFCEYCGVTYCKCTKIFNCANDNCDLMCSDHMIKCAKCDDYICKRCECDPNICDKCKLKNCLTPVN